MAIHFSIDSKELRQVLRPFFAGGGRGKAAALEYVDVKAREGEIEFLNTAISATIPGEVVYPGCARIPYRLFETLFRRPQRLDAGRLSVQIREGEIKAGTATANKFGISMRPIEARIADLPSDASLPETLSLTLRFSQEELEESGLWERVHAALRRSDELIDKATKILQPLNIGRDALARLVSEQIKAHAKCP
jgi:hypothetical protein